VIADRWGWQTAFLVTGFGPIAMVVACLLMQGQRPAPKAGRLLNFAPVFANREALGYIFGYGAHCFELYGIRTWLVGFWTFVVAHQGAPSWLSPVVLSFCFAVISMPASILGNEAALKFGRHRPPAPGYGARFCRWPAERRRLDARFHRPRGRDLDGPARTPLGPRRRDEKRDSSEMTARE
jgi:hypothetical protein